MIISIEGNIGTGKTTFIEILKQACRDYSNVIFIKEPVDQWLSLTDSDGENILQKFYSDQLRWSYSFQMNAFITRSKLIQQNNPKDNIIIVERSVLTDRNVFANLLKDNGKISDMEWKLYDEWFYWLTNSLNIVPDIYLYLKADYTISYERMKKRSRKEEDLVPLDYIKSVSEKHDEWLLNENNCITVDVNDDFENDMVRQGQLIDQLKNIINSRIK